MPAPRSGSTAEALEIALSADLKRGLPYLKHVGPYNGELNTTEGFEQFRSALAGRTPAALISTADSTFSVQEVRRRRYEETIAIDVIVSSLNYRGRPTGATSLGDDTSRLSDDVGVLKVMDDAVAWLAGHDLGLDGVGVLTPLYRRALLQTPQFNIWILGFAVDVDWDVESRAERTAEDLGEIGGRVTLPDEEGTILEGSADSLALDAPGSVRLIDADAVFTAMFVGLELVIEDARVEGNNGRFTVVSVPSATELTFANRLGAAEAPFAGTYKLRMPPVTLLNLEEES